MHCKSILFKLLNYKVHYNMFYCSPYLVLMELTFLDLIRFAKIFRTTKRFALPFDSCIFLYYIYLCTKMSMTRSEFSQRSLRGSGSF